MNINNEDLTKIYDENQDNGIKSVSYGWKIVNGTMTNELSIIFGVEKKLPKNELTGKYIVPSTVDINGTIYKTDVIEQKIIQPLSCIPTLIVDGNGKGHKDKVRPLKGGVQIFGEIYQGGPIGTLGLICQDKLTKAVVGLSNMHVISPNSVVNRWSFPNNLGSLLFFPRIRGWSDFSQIEFPPTDGTVRYPNVRSWPWYYPNDRTVPSRIRQPVTDHETFGVYYHSFIAQGADKNNLRADTIGTVYKVKPVYGKNLCRIYGAPSNCTSIKNYIDGALIALRKSVDGINLIDNFSHNQLGISNINGATNYTNSIIPWASTAELNTLVSSKIPLAKAGRSTNTMISPFCVNIPNTQNFYPVDLRVTQMNVNITVNYYGYGNEYVGVNKNTNEPPAEMNADFIDICKIEPVNPATDSVEVGVSIAMGGDSGSVVLGKFGSTWKVVGLLFAAEGGSIFGGSSAAYFARIDRVAETLGIEPFDPNLNPRKYVKVDSPKFAWEFAGYNFTARTTNFNTYSNGTISRPLKFTIDSDFANTLPRPLPIHSTIRKNLRYSLTNQGGFGIASERWNLAGLDSDPVLMYRLMKNYDTSSKNWCNALGKVYPSYYSDGNNLPVCS